MRKFIIKNRTKRKYTKKADQQSSLLFGKTFFNILPLLIMIIVLMTTLVISSPTRMPLSNIHFSFSIPSFSLQNPLPFLQTLGTDGMQIALAISSGISMFIAIVLYNLDTLVSVIRNSIVSIDLTPFLNLIGSSFQTVISAMQWLFSVLIHILTLGVSLMLQLLQTLIQNFIYNLTVISQFIFNSIIFLGNEVMQGSLLVAKAVSGVTLFLYHYIAWLILTIGMWIWSVFGAINIWCNHTAQTIAYLVSWPFKTIAAYFMQYKPMTDALGKHLIIGLNDMSACFTNFSKTLHILGTSK